MNGFMDHMWNFWGMGWGMWFWLLILIGAGYLFYVYPAPGHIATGGRTPWRSPERDSPGGR